MCFLSGKLQALTLHALLKADSGLLELSASFGRLNSLARKSTIDGEMVNSSKL